MATIPVVMFFSLLILGQLTVAANSDIRSISTGTTFGECFRYCRRSINITNSPLELVASKEPNGYDAAYPLTQRSFPFTQSQWEIVVALLDVDRFKMLDDRIGCPDCTDGGAEWIQVNWPNEIKRVTFEYGKLVGGIEELIAHLRVLREQYQKDL